MIVCLVDTSVLCELLRVPGKSSQSVHEETVAEFDQKVSAKHTLLLPVAAILETGNHIAHASTKRRATAERFVSLVRLAIEGDAPFKVTQPISVEEIASWLDHVADDADRELSLGDRSIIAEWERERVIHRGGRVYIWSLDNHLRGYDADPT